MSGTAEKTSTRHRGRRWAALVGAAALTVAAGTAPAWAAADHHGGPGSGGHGTVHTTTPIKHLVVIFGENVSFDHYFGTYPKAANTDGTPFTAAPHTPKANTLVTSGLLNSNPNLYAPQRLSGKQALTCDQNHNYTPEQYAEDSGKMDKFVQYTSKDTCSGGLYGAPGLAMDYYDGNTVSALWNYAQHYTLNDNSFDDEYGPSTVGALNLISGQTHGVVSVTGNGSTTDPTQTTTPDPYTVHSPNAQGVGTVNADPDPAYDDCADNNHTSNSALAEMQGTNVGDLLNSRHVTWGWFQGGFAPTTPYNGTSGYAVCGATHTNLGGATVADYSAHHDPFEYYKSTSNPHHVAPASEAEIGNNGQANHQYDLSYFDEAVTAGNLPAVSFLKAGEYQDGHAGYSDPIDEQNFLVKEINALQSSPEWSSTAVVLAYDDSDGWYDHVYHAPTNGSTDTTAASSTTTTDDAACQAGPAAKKGYEDRCGVGARQPLMVISPYARTNHISNTFTDQSSITKFIEDNWRLGRIGDGSFDASAGSLDSAFNFGCPNNVRVLLNSNGSVASVTPIRHGDDSDTPMAINASPTAASSSSDNGATMLSISLGAGAVVALGTGTVVSRRSRRKALGRA
ncbi:phospholipase C [Streptacidiphilus fuscans]|uniref:Alkaline phosphatase family protein n=1 Tax=Streptacidiphilus fuscans TaxID=2789292 RepID=A0A931B939_9ACTN|nr:alkaline phosphatase family protein [Streptacidiphilus fuscans]MBF9070917.1 alkaline phosphatase family protein [Streptacidiphilus fuscans]